MLARHFTPGDAVKYLVVYWSRFGNNRKLAEHLSKVLMRKGQVSLLTADRADPDALPNADVYVFSAASEKFSIQTDMKKLMKALKGFEGRKCAIINTHGLRWGNGLGKMRKMLSRSGLQVAAELDFRVGEGTDKGNGLPEGWEKRLEDFAAKL